MPKLSALIAGRDEDLLQRYAEALEAANKDPSLVSALDDFDPDMVDPCVYGVEVDTDDPNLPHGIKVIGLLARTEKGEFTDLVADQMINLRHAHHDVVMEFEDKVEVDDYVYLVASAAAVEVSLSFLPPEDPSDEAFEAYCQKMEKVTQAYLNQPNILYSVMPVTSYLEYMFLELIDAELASTFVPSDEYIIRRFHSKMTVERSDAMKARIRKVIHDHYGGEADFQDFAQQMFGGICAAVDKELAAAVAREAPVAPPVITTDETLAAE